MKHLATLSIAAALMVAAAAPAGARAPAGPQGCEQGGNTALAAKGFVLGVDAVDRDGAAARFIRPPRNGMFRCMYVSYDAGIAYERGIRGLPLPRVSGLTAYVAQAYVAGRAQRLDR